MTASHKEHLYFRGFPTVLEAMALALPSREAVCEVRLRLDEKAHREPVALRVQPMGVAARLRFSLPVTTPPGRYQATIHVEGQELPATVDIEPLRSLVAIPGHFHFVVKPGGEDEMRIALLNTGNVDWPTPEVIGFGIFEANGVEKALAAVYRTPGLRGQERLDKLADELADRNALVRGKVEEDPKVLKPAEATKLTVTLRWPEGLKPGRVYTGMWLPPLSNLSLQVSAEVGTDVGTEESGSEGKPHRRGDVHPKAR